MPVRPAKPCAHAGCHALVRGATYCGTHAQEAATRLARSDRKRRGTARQRGYDTLWQKVRDQHLLTQPLCVSCKADGLTVVAQDVDHIVPFKGVDDPRRLDSGNLQSLCRVHHGRKTARERA